MGGVTHTLKGRTRQESKVMLNRLVNSVDHQLCLMNEFKIFMTMVCGLEAGLEQREERKNA